MRENVSVTVVSDGIPGTHIDAVCSDSTSLSPNLLICLQLDISDSLVLAAAQQFVSLGLKNAGYEYVNIDVRLLGYLISIWQFTHFHARIAGQCKLEIRLPTRSILTQRNFLMALMDLQTRFISLGLK